MMEHSSGSLKHTLQDHTWTPMDWACVFQNGITILQWYNKAQTP